MQEEGYQNFRSSIHFKRCMLVEFDIRKFKDEATTSIFLLYLLIMEKEFHGLAESCLDVLNCTHNVKSQTFITKLLNIYLLSFVKIETSNIEKRRRIL